MLGFKSVRTIFNLIDRGALRPVREGKNVGVREDDVIAYRNSRAKSDGERTLPFAINRETMARHDTELRVLRRDVDMILNVLNIRRTHLKMSDLEMVALYNTAKEYGEKGWPPQVEETWAKYFLQMHTDCFLQIERRTKDHHPWRPFHKLARTMQLQPYNTELLLQLAAGREQVEHMAAVWAEIKQIPPIQIDAMLAREAKPSKRLLNSLSKKQKKISAKAEAVTG